MQTKLKMRIKEIVIKMKAYIFIILIALVLIPQAEANPYAICVYDYYNNYAQGAYVQVQGGPSGYTDAYGIFYADLNPNIWYYIRAQSGSQWGEWKGVPQGRIEIKMH
jgi:hypothetical protein